MVLGQGGCRQEQQGRESLLVGLAGAGERAEGREQDREMWGCCRVQQRATEVIVLVWTGMELMLLLVAGMGLCFGFVLNTVLISPGGFRYC